jgi:hypothetical protein
LGYDWPEKYTTQTLSRSSIDTSWLVAKDAETMRAWTIYEDQWLPALLSPETPKLFC